MSLGLAGVRQAWSLRATLALFVGLTAISAWVVGLVVMMEAAEREAEVLHDRELKQVAQLLIGLSSHEIPEVAHLSVAERIFNGRQDTEDSLGDDYRYQVWSAEGNFMMGNFGKASASPMAPFSKTGFGNVFMDNEMWRIYTQCVDGCALQIQVAERAALRAWTLSSLDLRHGMLLVGSLFLVMLPALALLRSILRPLGQLAKDLEDQTPATLRPLSTRGEPLELQVVIGAINSLIQRVRVAIQRESEFTALAAHELRTPLASLRILAENVSQAADESERTAALHELMVSANRCSRLQEQLLTLSRLEQHAADPASNEVVSLLDTVTDAMADVLPQAKAKGIKLANVNDGAQLKGSAFALLTLVRNLLANAVRHTPPGGRVEVEVCTAGRDVILRVDDSGPGIPEPLREAVFERFTRLNAGSDGGVGLGLSIVRAVTTAHDAQISLHTSLLGGLSVQVVFAGRALNAPEERMDSGWTEAAKS